MRRPRFTIATLLALVVVMAVSFAALREATDLWDGGVFTAALAALLVSVLLAVHRTDNQRAFWLGFALFGSAYLIGSLSPPVESRLPTTKDLALLDSKLSDRVVAGTWALSTAGGSPTTGYAMPTLALSADGKWLVDGMGGLVQVMNPVTGAPVAGPYGTTANFVRIGHSLLALVIGFVGGCLSRRLYASGTTG
jgi:hypothetical protein